MSSELILEQSIKSFDGYQYVYSHESFTVECKMKFGIYIPNIADHESVPLLIFLSNFKCNEQSFITKSGVQRLASKYGFIVANPDTNPRNCENECEDEGYYIDATQSPWIENYQMFSYINDEFYELILSNFNVDIDRIGIFGHGIGGHGALISFFKRPSQYKSISALAPICQPMKCQSSRNAFLKFLGESKLMIIKTDQIKPY
ncbi:hypothetical protein I4U23_013223 [Adineta vaga]|nr:hypothetical protein I4U23_013223 [Adineta vaga]